MKVLIVNTPTGQYALSLRSVSEHRANYYAIEVDGHELDSEEWEEEVEFCMKDKFEAIDWIVNNSNWEEWKEHAIKLNDNILVTDESFWKSSYDFEIIDAVLTIN
jgi:hypothetical protein